MTRRQRLTCDRRQARGRLVSAQDFLDAAELAQSHGLHDPACSNAVLAGVAAVDALCCALLGERAADHDQAIKLVESVDRDAAARFRRLAGLKYRAQYDHRPVTESEVKTAIRAAEALLERARRELAE